ncbi:hypothetical protein BLNAU_770 [Blattamonas nauphoetae]|uniref:Tail specific protease domain-containing protein n=1 Tax=Blattamonas nauphoetae TaxID=2049346 RepID=A0ABQ9YKG8_9EUKA|nr:hypothetical protein BLNAU_770 [Blattamonas nauphoetae]
MLIRFILASAFLQSVQCACSVKPGVNKLNEFEECLATLKDDSSKTEMRTSLNAAYSYVEHYSFLHHAKNPPKEMQSDVDKVDLLHELRFLNNTIPSYNSLPQFHIALSRVLAKVRDANLFYTPPCLSTFNYDFPYSLKLDVSNESNPRIKLETRTVHDFTKLFESDNKINTTLNGATVTKWNITGSSSGDPVADLAKWANENVFYSKSSSVRFNLALQSWFMTRHASHAEVPKPVHVELTLDGGSKVTHDIGFYVYNLGDKTYTDLNTLCPTIKKTNSDIQKPSIDHSEVASILSDVPEFESLPNERHSHNRYFDEEEIKHTIAKVLNVESVGSFSGVYHFDYQVYTAVLHDVKLGFIKITYFSREGHYGFRDAMALGFQRIRDAGCDKLLIDLRGCDTGAANMADQFLLSLFPDAFPAMPLEDSETGEFSSFMNLYHNGTTEHLIDPDTLAQISPDKVRTRKFQEVDGREIEKEYFTQYRRKHTSGDMYAAYYYYWGNRPTDFSRLFSPEQVTVLTDGVCFGACARFMNNVKEKNLAKIVFCGGYPIKAPVNPTISSSAGTGKRYSASAVNSVYTNKKKDNPFTTFPRTTQDLVFGFSILYSSLKDKQDENWEYEFKAPHSIIPFYGPTYINTNVMLNTAQTVSDLGLFGKCEDGQITISDKCKADKSDPENTQYGYLCKNGAYDNSTCVSAGCKGGYYMNKSSSKCDPTPASYMYKPLQKINFFVILIAIILSATVVAVIVLGIVANMCCKRRRRGGGGGGPEGEYTKQENTI